MREVLLLIVYTIGVTTKIVARDPDDILGSFGDDTEDSSEHIGAAVAQVYQHPYAASLLLNNFYVCSAVVLNNYWVLTVSKCFDENQSDILSSYITQENLANFSIRAGSSYNNKGGDLYKIKMVKNNFDLQVTAAKLEIPMLFGSQVQAVKLPNVSDEATLGYLASIIAWTPNNHMRTVNAPVIDPYVCDKNTKMLPGQYICLGGVQDPNRHFCRRDNGGAVIQNNTLIAISSFIYKCALYTKTHAFPKVASFSTWLDNIIWDEDSRPKITTEPTTTTTSTTVKPHPNVSEAASSKTYYAEPNMYMLTLPFDPINVPLEPSEDNSVLPGMSLYESYLQSMSKAKQATSSKPATVQETTTLPQSIRPMPVYKKRFIRYNLDYN